MFELGTVVKVKGFDTKMCVERILESGQVECVWFDVDQLRRAAYDADQLVECAKQIMVCKLQLHSIQSVGALCASDNSPMPASRLRFGGVWEGSAEKQQMSENAIFGHWTPCAEFTASVKNAGVVEKLKEGKKYYVTFTEAPD